MRKLTAQFKIEGELLSANGDLYSNDEITEMVLQRLRNRSADFDKLIEDDGDDDVEEQLHDQDLMPENLENQATTMVDVTISVEDDALSKFEMDNDLIYMKVISEITNGNVKIVRDETQDNVSHISYE
ncbi:MAG TPA: hypothetical protein VF581_04025 [Flavobacterium sp.]|jgi:hypothetical protein